MHGFDLLALAGPREENGVDPGLLIRPDALLRLGDAAAAQGAGAADDDQRRILARRHRAPELAEHFFDRHQAVALPAERRGQHRILDRQRGDARRLQLFDRSHDVERVPVAVVGVDHQGQIAPARNAANLLGELGQGQDDEIGRPENRAGGDRAREHADLEPQRFRHARGHRVEHRRGVNADTAFEDPPILFASFGEEHHVPFVLAARGSCSASGAGATSNALRMAATMP